jgi:iron complex outermembrane receptor protein
VTRIKFKTDRFAAISLSALALASLSDAALAQTANAAVEADKNNADTIVVTGTRRTDRTVTESAVPIDVFTAQDLKTQPSPQLQTMLQTLVPSFNQQRNLLGDASAFVRPPTLRGLPPDQILVLVNGKRMHRSALVQVTGGALAQGAQGPDLSQIPQFQRSGRRYRKPQNSIRALAICLASELDCFLGSGRQHPRRP